MMAARAARGEQVFHPQDSRVVARVPSSNTGGGARDAAREAPRGVTWDGRRGKWRVRWKRKYLGMRATLAAAVELLRQAQGRATNQ